ncbi:hypothetical protein ABZ172_05400 [Streptomyces sp. NPDC006296]|uniref:hypothetical protein n=1 Tax=Streptomyces sp. NPDC006296 TaxID=3156746 RepID=UPI0033A2331D
MLSLGLAGCSGTTGPDEKDPKSGPVNASTPGATAAADGSDSADFTFRLPIAAYSYTEAQNADIGAAEDVLTERCMKRLGIPYTAVQAPEASRASDRRYGLSSAEDAARYGYHLPPKASFNPNKGLDAPTLVALYGRSAGIEGTADPSLDVPPRGCRGEAADSLDEDHRYRAGAETASGIARRSYQQATQDSRVREAVRRWSGCMADRGYTYSDPMAALGDERFLDKPVTEREVETARADMECKAEVRLLQTWFSVETAVQKDMIADGSAELEKLKEAHAAKAAEAREVTGRS